MLYLLVQCIPLSYPEEDSQPLETAFVERANCSSTLEVHPATLSEEGEVQTQAIR